MMMRWLGDLWFRVRAITRRGQLEREMAEEFGFHLEMEAKKYEEQGTPPQEAQRLARLKFGGEERFKEKARESWGVGAITDLGGAIRFAARQLLKHPAFSTLAIVTLALGIGGTVALFSVMNSLILRPLPIPDEDRVVNFWSDFNWRGEEFDYVSGVARAYESLAAHSNDAYTLRTEGGASLILATVASVELFEVLKVRPLLGRTFEPGEDRPGAEPVVVLGHALWEQEFGGSRDVLGRRVNIGGEQRTVVGVMPEDFYFPTPESDAFIPLDLDPDDPGYSGNGWLVLTGRLRPEITEAQLEEDLLAITTALGERYNYPEAWDKTRNPYVVPIREYLFGEVRPALRLLLAAVGVLLLMACVNVAALILTKTVDRQREMSVRTALGAGRARLARQVLTESMLLGLLAGAIGLALAVGMFDIIVTSIPMDPSFRGTARLDWAALGAALGLAVATGSLISLAPIRNLLRGDLSAGALTDRTRGAGAAHATRMQSTLVVAEVLLAVVLVTGATLLTRTVAQLRAVDLGFEPAGILTLDILASEEDTSVEERAAFYDQLLDRTAALPGVTSSALINRLPLRDGGFQGTVTVADRPDLDGANRPNAMYRPVTPGAFEALGAEILEGRGIRTTDIQDGPLVAVVNQTFARRIWGEESPIGKTYSTGFVGSVQIVGVIRDMAVTDLVGDPPMAGYYAWDQSMRGSAYAVLMAKTSGDPSALSAPIRAIVQELDRRSAIGRIETLDDALDTKMAEPLRLRFFLGLFSLLGLVLGTVGVYGVVSYSVERRQAEFGIRMALGAEPRRLLGTVVRDGMLPVLLGVIGGTIVAIALSKALAGFLFGVEPTDPASLLFAAGTLCGAGVIAALIPAVRASTARPAVALRGE